MNSVRLLNSMAASDAYAQNTPRILGGRLTIDANVPELEFISETDDTSDAIVVVQTSQDKKDSNPFYYGEEPNNNQKAEEV